MVVGTPERPHQLEASLSESGITAGLNKDRFQILDASTMLSEFMVDDRPSTEKFSGCIGQTIHGAKESFVNVQSGVTVFGEMVAVLWNEGKHGAALELDRIWNALLLKEQFQFHCAYPPRILKEHTNSMAVKAICDQHYTIVGLANSIK